MNTKQTDTSCKCIGIDLGTTYSCVSVWVDDHIEIISNTVGNKTTPSWVALVDTDNSNQSGDSRVSSQWIIGEEAKNQATNNSKQTYYDVKRLMGKQYNDPTVLRDAKNLHYDICPDSNDRVLIKSQNATYRPEEISSKILRYLKECAEEFMNCKISDAIITVPAYFNDAQRTATKNAARIAGLNCKRLINEPTSSCLCYGINNREAAKVLIFDLGGGTFDVSILELTGGIFEVLATCGDTHLGGEDFDNELQVYLFGKFKSKLNKNNIDINGISVTKIAKIKQKLKKTAEVVKKSLSMVNVTSVCVDLYDDIELDLRISRELFEDLCDREFQKCIIPINNVLKDADLKPCDIDEIVLVGGSTRIPKIQQLISDIFNGKKLNKTINPDEAVAYGAGVQGAILGCNDNSGKTNDLLLLDVIPLSMGIETQGGIMSRIVKRNSKIPLQCKEQYTPIDRDQHSVTIKIFEGERKITKYNHFLGTFEMSGLPKSINDKTIIDVTFSIDCDGILKVTAKETKSDTVIDVVIKKDDGNYLTDTEINEMISQSENNEQRDELLIELTELLNDIEKYLYDSECTINNDVTINTSVCTLCLTETEQAEANELIYNSLEYIASCKRECADNNDELFEKINREIINTFKENIKYHLTPFLNKVYARNVTNVSKIDDKYDDVDKAREKEILNMLS
jgi:heat shock 70kDa protein 1/2/6/8